MKGFIVPLKAGGSENVHQREFVVSQPSCRPVYRRYRVQATRGNIVGHIAKVNRIVDNGFAYREQGISGELLTHGAAKLLSLTLETERHDKQHALAKGGQRDFALEWQHTIDLILFRKVKNVFIQQRAPIT